MKVTLWGTRGSVASPGPETAIYGGNTACVAVQGSGGTLLAMDAGTGIRRLGAWVPRSLHRVDVLLTHLHMDHLQGLGFFAPLYNPRMDVHIWGPAGVTLNLRSRLIRYLSPPLFPVHLRDLPCKLTLHEVPCGIFEIGEFSVKATLLCHPGPTVGYRIVSSEGTLAYMPDHEPRLGWKEYPANREWLSGYSIAKEADLLIHDSQYFRSEYEKCVGWGHSAMSDALEFAMIAGVRRFVPFHHDPSHTDDDLDRLTAQSKDEVRPSFPISAGMEGAIFDLTAKSTKCRAKSKKRAA